MATLGSRYPKEDLSRRAQEIYRSDIRPTLSLADDGKFIIIDLETGTYELDPDELTATNRLQARCPDAQAFGFRVGSLATEVSGFRGLFVFGKDDAGSPR